MEHARACRITYPALNLTIAASYNTGDVDLDEAAYRSYRLWFDTNR